MQINWRCSSFDDCWLARGRRVTEEKHRKSIMDFELDNEPKCGRVKQKKYIIFAFNFHFGARNLCLKFPYSFKMCVVELCWTLLLSRSERQRAANRTSQWVEYVQFNFTSSSFALNELCVAHAHNTIKKSKIYLTIENINFDFHRNSSVSIPAKRKKLNRRKTNSQKL